MEWICVAEYGVQCADSCEHGNESLSSLVREIIFASWMTFSFWRRFDLQKLLINVNDSGLWYLMFVLNFVICKTVQTLWKGMGRYFRKLHKLISVFGNMVHCYVAEQSNCLRLWYIIINFGTDEKRTQREKITFRIQYWNWHRLCDALTTWM